MKYALIGCGRIAANHVKAATNNALDFVAMCDVDESKFDVMLDKADVGRFEETARYTDYRQMLADHPEIELVAIATESGEHARIALDCIDAGKHVIIEKPIAMSIEDADEIIRRSQDADVKVSACHQNRFNVAVQRMREALEQGRFGRLSHGSINVRWNRNKAYYDQAPWRGTWEQDGGCLMNQCIHGIDLLRWMMGDRATEVFAATRQRQHDYLEAEDVGVGVVKFANGAVGTIEGTTNVYPRNLEETLSVFGEMGTAKLGGTSCNNIDVWTFDDEREEDADSAGLKEATSNVYGNGHTALYADMIASIRGDRAPYVDAVAGRNALEIVLAMYKSQKTGMPVTLPLKDFASTDMTGEFE